MAWDLSGVVPPGWRATLDGADVTPQLLRANGGHTALPVPAGEHVLEVELLNAMVLAWGFAVSLRVVLDNTRSARTSPQSAS
ncbi:MAG: hypothetical protein KatS3mg130_1530 [Candidatus Sumerlaea sp.]|nr:MAG: hypothetical protein KatS3mg130_1530 [Candidatus Sumerlaea sp.]